MNVQDSRLSPLKNALAQATSADSEGGATVTPNELKQLKAKAASGHAIAEADINRLMEEVTRDGGPAKDESLRALQEMKTSANQGGQAYSDALSTTLQVIDTVNPAAWGRWLLGGSKPGCGLW
ncbi:MAG: hypothetical protein HY791_08975 [Deltaproteobacteria bacterium]|nr:hypothetical protein [Deltaproteobacteria bacterium]